MRESRVLCALHAKELIDSEIPIEQLGLSISNEAIYQYTYHPDFKGHQELIQCPRRRYRKRNEQGHRQKRA